jgi:hypothetical protein
MSLTSFLFQIIDEWKTRVRAGTGKDLQKNWILLKYLLVKA